ncbi:hypothetical protein RRF57_004921 [Xylaria bambusicola]|uniref:Uncharacterized protein n=1 Tax=Xylaria bambusicola TaxID=326684 RepID=A0AAN7UML6_9PEZI
MRRISIDENQLARRVAAAESALAEKWNKSGPYSASLKNEKDETNKLIDEHEKLCHNLEKTRDRVQDESADLRSLADQIKKILDRNDNIGSWVSVLRKLKREEYEGMLSAIIGKEGSLERLRTMSDDTRRLLFNQELVMCKTDLDRYKRLSALYAEEQSEHKKEIEKGKKELQKATKDLEQYRNEWLEKEKELKQKDELIAGLEKAHGDARDSHAKVAQKKDEEIKNLKERLNISKLEGSEQYREFTDKLEALQQQLNMTQDANDLSTKMLEAAEKSRDGYKQQENKLWNQALGYKTAAEASRKEVQKMKEDAETARQNYEHQVQKAKKETEALRQQAKRIEEKTEAARQKYEQQAKQAREEAETARRNHEEQLKRIEQEVKDARVQHENELRQKEVEAETTCVQHDSRIRQMEEEAKTARGKHEQELQELQQCMENDRRDRARRDEDHHEVVEQVKEAINNLFSENEVLQRDLQQRDRTIIDLQGKINEVEQLKTSAETQRAGLEQSLEANRNELAECRVQNERLETQVSSISSDLEERKAMLVNVARMFRAQSGYEQGDLEKWVKFVEVAGQSTSIEFGNPLMGQDLSWTILQQWDSDTVVLGPVGNETMEQILVRLYGKVVVGEVDDETVDLIRRLIRDAESIGLVSFSLMVFVIEACIVAVGESRDYHALAVSFGLHQMVSVMATRSSQDVGDLQRRVEGLILDETSSIGALSVLLAGDGTRLTILIRNGQEVSLSGSGRVIASRYCPGRDLGVLILPNSSGYVWVLELGTNYVRRVATSRLIVTDSSQWIIKAVEGCENIVLPSESKEDWDWNFENLGSA